MPPPLLFPLSDADLSCTLWNRSQIYQRLPHAHEFQLLDGLCVLDVENRRAATYADIRPDAWWVRGHVPGRPILPGVLMIEMAAQTSVVLMKAALTEHQDFIAFGGVDECKFRDAVMPPCRLYLLCRAMDFRARRIVSTTQGVVDGRLVFEATITGLAMRG